MGGFVLVMPKVMHADSKFKIIW